MEKKRYVYWRDEDMWLGYLEEFPDYMSQGESLEELKENLIDIYKEIDSLEKSEIESIRFVDYRESFLWLALTGFILIICEVILRNTLFRRIP